MQSIEQKALETYQKNLDYLKGTHTDIYQLIITFEEAIASGGYKERFSLEWLSDTYFDIIENETGLKYYGENSYQHAQKIIDLTDTSRFKGIFRGQRYVDFSPEMPDIIDKSKLSFHNALWATAKIIEYSKRVAPSHDTHMKHVYKLMFLGTGLGLHINDICKKLNGKVIFIKEDDIEIFRLSLFTTNYALIAKTCEIFFSIMDSEEALTKHFVDFMERGNDYNLYLKYFPMTQNYEEQTLLLHSILMKQDHILYPYSAYLLRYIDGPKYIVQEYKFLNISKRLHETALSERPLLLLFSGPSTIKNIEWICKNSSKFTIVTALSTCKLLYTYGIKPNIVFHIDPEEKGSLRLLEGIEKSYFDNTVCIFSSNIHEKVIQFFNKQSCYIIQQAVHYKANFQHYSSPTVGEYSYAISLLFGAKSLYLLGIDLALDPETLSSHAQGFHPFAETRDKNTDTSDQLEKTLIEVKGNFLTTVPTYPTYKISINEFEKISKMMLNESVQVYNLSNGAYLEGAVPLKIEEININNFSINDNHKELVNFFNSMSCANFREEDRAIIKYQLDEAKKLKKIIQKHKKKHFALSALYLQSLASLAWELSDMKKETHSDLAEVFYYYFKVVLSYITDIFNTKEFMATPKHIKELNILLIHQLEKMTNLYIDTMEKYLK